MAVAAVAPSPLGRVRHGDGSARPRDHVLRGRRRAQLVAECAAIVRHRREAPRRRSAVDVAHAAGARGPLRPRYRGTGDRGGGGEDGGGADVRGVAARSDAVRRHRGERAARRVHIEEEHAAAAAVAHLRRRRLRLGVRCLPQRQPDPVRRGRGVDPPAVASARRTAPRRPTMGRRPPPPDGALLAAVHGECAGERRRRRRAPQG